MELSFRAYQNLPLSEDPRTRAEIDLDALRRNYQTLCAALPSGCRGIAVVKADAYGHGAAACAKALFGAGCSFFAVSCLEEGVALRQALGNRRANILVLGYTNPAAARELAEADLIQALISPGYAKDLLRASAHAGVVLRVHYAVDTGMNRVGFLARNEKERIQTVNEILEFASNPVFRSEGLFSHFASAGEEETFTSLQAKRFDRIKSMLAKKGCRLFCHLCNSAGALTRPRDCLDGVRLGIALWGVPTGNLPLQPVMRLCTKIVHLHPVSPGDRVGYGGDFSVKKKGVIATLPIGYADGWMRAYRGATVAVQTGRGVFSAPLVGRICMDQCMADVTGIPAEIGDRVVLFGQEPDALPKLAKRAGTIAYESLCAISARVLRIYQEKEISK